MCVLENKFVLYIKNMFDILTVKLVIFLFLHLLRLYFLVDITTNTIRNFVEVFSSFDRQQMHVEQPQQSAMYQQQPAPQMYPSMQQQSKLLIRESFMYEIWGFLCTSYFYPMLFEFLI